MGLGTAQNCGLYALRAADFARAAVAAIYDGFVGSFSFQHRVMIRRHSFVSVG